MALTVLYVLRARAEHGLVHVLRLAASRVPNEQGAALEVFMTFSRTIIWAWLSYMCSAHGQNIRTCIYSLLEAWGFARCQLRGDAVSQERRGVVRLFSEWDRLCDGTEPDPTGEQWAAPNEP